MGRLAGIAALVVAATIVVLAFWGGDAEAPDAGAKAVLPATGPAKQASAHEPAAEPAASRLSTQRLRFVTETARPEGAAARRLAGHLVGPSGRGIPGGIITILHPDRHKDPSAFEVVTDNRGAFVIDIKTEWLPSGHAYVQASGRASGLFEGFVPVRDDVTILTDIDEDSDAWLLQGFVGLPAPEPQWVVNVLSRPDGAQPDIIASSMFENPYSGKQSEVRLRFVDRSRLAWEGPVWLSVCRPGRQALVASRHFGSMAHLRQGLGEGIWLESVASTLRVPRIEAEWPITVALLDVEYAFGYYPATGGESEWKIRASPGTYRLRATTASNIIAEAHIDVSTSDEEVAVEGWGSIHPGSCSMQVIIEGEWSGRTSHARVDVNRLDPSTGIAWPYPVQSQATTQGVVLRGLHPGAYQIQLFAQKGRYASRIRKIEVPIEEPVYVQVEEVGQIVCSIRDEWSLGPTGTMNSRLAWRSDVSGSWNVVQRSPISSEGLVVPNVPLGQTVEVVAGGSSAGGLAWIASGRCPVDNSIVFLSMEVEVGADLVGHVRTQDGRAGMGFSVTIEGVDLGPVSRADVSASGEFRLRIPVVLSPLPRLVVSNAAGNVVLFRPLQEEDLGTPIMVVLPQ